MLRNYLVTAIRNIKRHKAFSIINILGLAAGMAVCIMIMIYAQSELSYDKFNPGYENIFRIKNEFGDPRFIKFAKEGSNKCPAMLKDVLLQKYPEVIEAARIRSASSEGKIKYNGNLSIEKKYLNVDPSFYDIFGYEFIEGDKNTATQSINTMVVTENYAKKYFGNISPINKIMNIDGKDYQIGAVLKNVPVNSHLKFDYLLPLKIDSAEQGNWDRLNFALYLKLKDKADWNNLQRKIISLPGQYTSNIFKDDKLYLQPLGSIHFYSKTLFEFESPGDIKTLYGLIMLGAIVLLLACINFVNISTARLSARTTEIGLRKTVGAKRKEIIKQFIVESVCFSLWALGAAIIIVAAARPLFNELVETEINISMLYQLNSIIILIVFAVTTGVIAGIYPALIFSSFKPAEIINRKSLVKGNTGNAMLRKSLITFQFIICSLLIISVITINKQLHYINKKDMGYNIERILTIPLKYDMYGGREVFKSELLKNPIIKSVSFSTYPANNIDSRQNFFWDNSSNNQMLCGNAVDEDFIKTYNIKLIQGRDIIKPASEGAEEQYILNESAVKLMKLTQPIGVKMGSGKKIYGSVVGVVKDFHFKNLHEEISPLVMAVKINGYTCISIKIITDNITGALKSIEKKHKGIYPEVPFEYSFVDEQFGKMYQKEILLSKTTNTFSLLSIFVACLGLLGLVMFSIEKRRKEIGIRKALGAEIKSIIYLLSKEFIGLIIIANIIAIPVSYYLMRLWLNDFAYKTDISWWIFLLAMAVSLVIAMLTISWQTYKAATANPVESIRYE